MKRISPATVTFGVMAIVLGLVAAYVVRQALHKPPVVQKPAPPPPAPETVSVVFATNVIPKHTRLSSRDVFVTQVPKGAKLPPGVFRGVNLVEGRITKETIRCQKSKDLVEDIALVLRRPLIHGRISPPRMESNRSRTPVINRVQCRTAASP